MKIAETVTNTVLADGSSWINFDVHGLVSDFWVSTFDGLTQGSIYALIAIGYTLVYGVLRLINFAHSEVFIIGAYGVYFTFSGLGFESGHTPDLGIGELIVDLALAAGVAMILSAATALVVERVAYRPLRKRNAPPLVFLITAIGASFVIQQLIFIWRGGNAEPGIRLFKPTPVFSLFGVNIENRQILIVVAALILMLVVDQFLRRTRLGRGIRAVAQDPDTATLMGVNKERVIMLTFIIGGALAGAAALFYMIKIPQGAQYQGGFLLGLKAFTAAVLGGIGNIRGALIGGMLLGVFENYGQSLFGGEWKDVVAFVLLIVILMVRPTGLLGESLGKARV